MRASVEASLWPCSFDIRTAWTNAESQCKLLGFRTFFELTIPIKAIKCYALLLSLRKRGGYTLELRSFGFGRRGCDPTLSPTNVMQEHSTVSCSTVKRTSQTVSCSTIQKVPGGLTDGQQIESKTVDQRCSLENSRCNSTLC